MISESPGRRDGGRGTRWKTPASIVLLSLPRCGGSVPLPGGEGRPRGGRRARGRVEESCVRGNERLVLALPKGRILGEVIPVVRRAGIEIEHAFDDPDSRQLRFATNHPGLDVIRMRNFDVATFVAFGAAHFGVAGNDVLMEVEDR